MNKRISLLTIILGLILVQSKAQSEQDSIVIRNMYDEALLRGHAYENLRVLCKDVGNRLSGSEGADKAVEWGFNLLHSYQFDTVWKQPIKVPKWVRGNRERLSIEGSNEELKILALGGSIGTNGLLKAPLVVIKNLDELKNTPEEKIKGKIVLLNHKFEHQHINTFQAYGPCAGQRYLGAVESAKKGAVACLVRSAGSLLDDFPHTGSMKYEDGIKKIPTAAVSVLAAERLTDLAKQETILNLEMNCLDGGMVPSHNVIADLKGSEFPNKILLVGGHLDSWDVGEGAHDDGAGIIHAIEALRIFKTLGIRPKHTIRCVLYMNEENGNNGGKSYANWAKTSGEEHVAALESDRGGFVPRGFDMDAQDYQLAKVQQWRKILEPYNLHIFKRGFGGVDINPLKDGKVALIGFIPDSQRYFDFHHTDDDIFENVHKRELELGCSSIASLLYLIDQYGFIEEQ